MCFEPAGTECALLIKCEWTSFNFACLWSARKRATENAQGTRSDVRSTWLLPAARASRKIELPIALPAQVAPKCDCCASHRPSFAAAELILGVETPYAGLSST